MAAVASPASANPDSAANVATECTGTLKGTFDRIVVPGGAMCRLVDATVIHNVVVAPDGALHAMSSTLGSFDARSAAMVRLTDTDVLGDVDVRGTVGVTAIGGTDCVVDPLIQGNLEVKAALGNVALCDLTVRNNIIVNGNAGRVGIFRNVVGNNIEVFNNTGLANRIRNNTIRQKLDCHDNTGTVISTGNTAAQFLGQCTA